MSNAKSAISDAYTPQDVGSYWDHHDLGESWNQTEPVSFEVEGMSQAIYYPVEMTLSQKLRTKAAQRGISAETLLNLWLQEKMNEPAAT